MDWSSSDLPTAFRQFQELCELIFEGPFHEKTEELKVHYLKIWVGTEGRELIATWKLNDADKKKLKTYWDKFNAYAAPKSNFRLARYKLRGIEQGPDEAIDKFVKRIRMLTAECKYTNPEEQTIDAIIFGGNNEAVRSKLLKKDDTLTVEQAIEITRIEEVAKQQSAVMNTADNLKTTQVNAVKTIKQPVSKDDKLSRPRLVSKSQESHDFLGDGSVRPKHTQKYTEKFPERFPKCGRCGTRHASGTETCPAIGSTCDHCGGRNHWRPVCRARRKTEPGRRSRQVHTLNAQEFTDSDDDNLYFNELRIHALNQANYNECENEIVTKLAIQSKHCRKRLSCKLDTGAQGNAMSLETYKLLHPHSKCDEFGLPIGINKSKVKIVAYGNNQIKTYGVCTLRIQVKNRFHLDTFHIVNVPGPIIIGYPACKALKLVTLNFTLDCKPQPVNDSKCSAGSSDDSAKQQVLQEYPDCFQGIGCFAGTYHITLDHSVPPVVHPPRRVPEALRQPLKAELDKLEQESIISKVEKPTDWVNSFVCVTKPNGKLRLCLDPKDLNKAIKRPHYVTPTLDDITPKLKDAKYFTILDARSGYWNIRLDEESSYFTTFNSPFGRYKFNRLPFGLVCAQDIFQKKIDETFGDLPGVTGIADDIVIYGNSAERHDEVLKSVLNRARERGLKFNPDKMVVKTQQIKFFGNIIGCDGMKADPAKISAIQQMEQPKNLKELQTFLGMVNYLSRYAPNLSAVTAPLRDLCKQNTEFIWGYEHNKSFTDTKQLIASPVILKYYDSKCPLVIQVDASQKGLGVAALQPQGPIAFASKSLTDAEKRYSNIERELLGIVFGLERFHYYAYGRHVVIETDHKPLTSIYNKNLASASPRLARMLLRIQKYDIEIKYVPGKDIGLADALSRINPCVGDTIKGLDVTVHEMHLQINASPNRIRQIRDETVKDPALSVLKDCIMKGFPEKRQSCPPLILEYWNYRDELHCADGVIMKGDRVVVPKSLQADALEQIHYAHQGTEKCKLRAKGAVFWPGINNDIDNTVNSCATCQRHRSASVKEPMIPHDVPPRAWHTLGSDIFYWNNTHYLLIVDYFSKFPIIRKLTNITSKSVIAQMKGIFEEHGIPEKLVSDGGTQYTSSEFANFSQTYGFIHVFSSPHYPQSNGLSERNVQTVKNILQKALDTGSDPHLALLCHRTTAIDHNTPSPCEMLNSRKYKANLPIMNGKVNNDDLNSVLQKRQDHQKEMYDRNAKSLPAMYPNECVRVCDPVTKLWEPGKILAKTDAPRSYLVETNGATYRRNQRFIHKTGEKFGSLNKPIVIDDDDFPPVQLKDHNVQPQVDPVSPVNSNQEIRRSGRTTRKPERLDL